MTLPSLRIVFVAAGETLRRFPLVLAAAVLAAVAGIVVAGDADEMTPWVRTLLAATLGLPLFTAIALTVERRALSVAVRVALPALAAALLVAFQWGAGRWLEPVLVARYVQLSLAAHLLVSFLPYAGRRPAPGFWPYNKTLFLRFLVATIFAAVLFFGLAMALAAVDKLFGVHVEEESYLRLWIVIAFVFHSWYFLGGIPRDLSSLDDSTDYPGGLRVFAQYILVPLVTVYLVILTAYFVRVIVTREWPSGWIGWLVSSVSVAGLLAQLLVHPVKDRPENRWVGSCTRAFHIGLIPAVLMLFAAIAQRVQQYGFTENRYFLSVWAVWILGITLYFMIGRRRSIRVIPASLAALVIGTSFGPWGAYAVAERNQVARLDGILRENGMIENGRVRAAAAPVSFEDRKEISAVVRYLAEYHGVDVIEHWFEGGLAEAESLAAGTPSTSRARGDTSARAVLTRLQLDYVERWHTEARRDFTYTGSRHGLSVDIGEYDTAVRFAKLDEPGEEGYSLLWDPVGPSFVVRREGTVLIEFPAEEALKMARAATGARDHMQLAPGLLDLQARNANVRALLALEQVTGHDGPEGPTLQFVTGTLYLGAPTP